MDELEYLKRKIKIIELVVKDIVGFEVSTSEWGTQKHQYFTALAAAANEQQDNLDAESADIGILPDVPNGGDDE